VVIQDLHKLVVFGFSFLVALRPYELSDSQGSVLCQSLPVVGETLFNKPLIAVLDISLQHRIGFFLRNTTKIQIEADNDSQLACSTAEWLQSQTLMSD